MKIKVQFLSYCILAFGTLPVVAQQFPEVTIDTAAIPVVSEVPRFVNYNFSYKTRLDSIQKTVPLAYNEFVQKYIDVYSVRKDMMGKMLGLSEYYFPIFEKALQSYNIPDEIKYLPIIESSMNPHAVSRVGATGLWQFMFGTAKGYGLHIDNYVDERKDPIQASYAAAAYFRDAYEELGDWVLAIAAYNCGMGSVKRAIQKADSRDFWEIRRFLPTETRNYVPAFIAAVYVMSCPDKHQISSLKSAFFKNTDTIQVNRVISLATIANAMNLEQEELFGLNPSYKKKIVNGSVAIPKRIILPKVSLSDFAALYDVLNKDDQQSAMKVVLASNDGYHSPKAKTKAKSPFFYHKVSSGQNLSVIANKYHIEVQDLKVWNNLKGASIVPGQKLKIYDAGDEKASSKPSRG
ncbi:transglycosylase SLT domain-containing protein [Pedobacter sp. JCM 36344]|uniref:lytic transglycosylase domain-containing protein n=1 Tax=Pedobacter sp. JCM 36344 TaxID=3374280 RepID=UPI00397BCB6B